MVALLHALSLWLAGEEGPAARHAASVELERVGLLPGLVARVRVAAAATAAVGSEAVAIEAGVLSLRILRDFFALSPPRAKLALAGGTLEPLTTLMGHWPERAEVQAAATSFLGVLLKDPAAVTEALRLDVPALIYTALARHPGNFEVKSGSDEVMQALHSQPEEWMSYKQRVLSEPSLRANWRMAACAV